MEGYKSNIQPIKYLNTFANLYLQICLFTFHTPSKNYYPLSNKESLWIMTGLLLFPIITYRGSLEEIYMKEYIH